MFLNFLARIEELPDGYFIQLVNDLMNNFALTSSDTSNLKESEYIRIYSQLYERFGKKIRLSQGWKEERWDWETPSISESEAIEQAAQMVDRFHRMYCRSIRLLQGLRKNSPQVTINNPQQVNMGEQVNIATDGGQQINVKADSNNQR